MTSVRKLLAHVVDVRPDEVRAMFLSGCYFFFLLASYFVLRPIRDTMGVAAGVSRLPWLFVATLTATLVCQPLFGALVARFPARRFIPIAYQFFAANLLGFWLILRGLPDEMGAGTGLGLWMGRGFFVWISVFNLFVVSVFWSFMTDVFRSEQAKRLFGFIGVGGTLGSIAGSTVTASLAARLGTVNLLLVSFVLLEIATVIVLRFPASIGRRQDPRLIESAVEDESESVVGGSIWSGITHLARSPYLLGIGGFLILYTMGSTFLYFQQADIIGTHFPTSAARTEILAKIEVASQLLTVLTQIFLTGRIIKWIGLPATLAFMPALSVLGFSALGLSALGISALAAVPILGIFVTFSVLRRGTNFALTNPAMEVLFTVVPREDKYKAKNFIETFVYRAGDQLAAWTYTAFVALGLSRGTIAWPAAGLAALFLVVGVWLGRRQQELAQDHSPAAPINTGPGTMKSVVPAMTDREP